MVATMGLAAGISFSLRSCALAADSYKRAGVEHPMGEMKSCRCSAEQGAVAWMRSVMFWWGPTMCVCGMRFPASSLGAVWWIGGRCLGLCMRVEDGREPCRSHPSTVPPLHHAAY